MNFGVLYVLPCSCPLAPVIKVWSWSLWGQGGSSWPQVNPACPLTLSPHALHPVRLFGRLSWLKTRLKQAKWAQIAHETEPSWRLPDHPDGVGPSHHPSLQCPHHEDHHRYRGKKCQNGKNFFPPLEPSSRWLGDGQKKICILSTLTKVMGCQSQKYQKRVQKGHISRQMWG